MKQEGIQMARCKHITGFLLFLFLLAGIAPASMASEPPGSSGATSFGVGVTVVPRVIDLETLPQAVRATNEHLPGYARQWYIARINLQAGRSIDGFVFWSRQAMTDRSREPSWSEHQEDVSRLVLDSQKELMSAETKA